MKQRILTDETHSEHLLVLFGGPEQLDAFQRETQDEAGALCLTKALPPPALEDVDPLCIAHYHLMAGNDSGARAIYEELNVPYPLAGNETTLEMRAFLASRTDIQRDARCIQKNIHRGGAVDAREWKKDHWGGVADITGAASERPDAGCLIYRFSDRWNRERALLALVLKHAPAIKGGCIVADFWARKESWRFVQGRTDVVGEQREMTAGDGLVTLYIDNPPNVFF